MAFKALRALFLPALASGHAERSNEPVRFPALPERLSVARSDTSSASLLDACTLALYYNIHAASDPTRHNLGLASLG
jgi:hypothetical protein